MNHERGTRMRKRGMRQATPRGGPRMGAHMSIAGGVDKALLRGEEVGCDAMQIFTKNNNQWRGAPRGSGGAEGIKRMGEALETVLEGPQASPVMICLETTAGQGSSLGYRFEHLAAIRGGVTRRERVGICVDTCHIFAAGYEIRDQRAYEDTMRQLNGVVGLDHVTCIHLNDSQRDLGSRVDRHAHIGRGQIGLEGFRLLINDPRLQHIPLILETPKGEDPVAADSTH